MPDSYWHWEDWGMIKFSDGIGRAVETNAWGIPSLDIPDGMHLWLQFGAYDLSLSWWLDSLLVLGLMLESFDKVFSNTIGIQVR